METAEYIIIAVNVVLGVGLAWRLRPLLSRVCHGRIRGGYLFLLLLSGYVLECVAFAASMATNILSFLLALLWGVVLGSWLRRLSTPWPDRRRVLRRLAAYSGLPTASFASIPLMAFLAGWPVLSPVAGRQFGVPGFLPSPLCTILLFCLSVAVVGFAVKVVITVSVGSFLMQRGRGFQ